MQGGYVRRLPPQKIKSTAIYGLWIIVPSFICVGLAQGPFLLYFGLFLFAVCKLDLLGSKFCYNSQFDECAARTQC